MAKFNFEELKDTVMGAVGMAAMKTRDFAEKASDKVKLTTRITKLNVEINSQKNSIEKNYTELGKIYYDLHKNAPESMFVRLFDDIRVANENIARLENEINELKVSCTSDNDGSIEVEFEEINPDEEAPAVVNDDELTCSCGCEAHTEQPKEDSCTCGCDTHTEEPKEDSCSCGCDAHTEKKADAE